MARRYLAEIVPLKQIVYILGKYFCSIFYIWRTCMVFCLAESGAGKTYFVRSILQHILPGTERETARLK